MSSSSSRSGGLTGLGGVGAADCQYGNEVRDLIAGSRATALAAGSSSATVAGQLDTEYLYSADGIDLLDTYGPAHQATAAGILQTLRAHTHDVYDEGAPDNDQDANGNRYQLVTTETVSASLGTEVPGTSDVDGRTTQNDYNNGSDNTGWTLHTPLQTITDPGTGNLKVTHTTVYNENSSLYGGQSLPIESRLPSNTAGGGAGATKYIYYTAGANGANGADSACGNKPAWADLTRKTEPAGWRRWASRSSSRQCCSPCCGCRFPEATRGCARGHPSGTDKTEGSGLHGL
ncbi:hypothetical protein ACGFXB_43080 [Streptomyces canus]|uniref:hypothetical protein n=1 Tax=Streptomyces canus TaxID=58343 RepID=UPI003724C08A